MSSIFLHREFGVEVWAVDLWFSVTENLQRIRDAGVENGVFPIHADARSLPFADEFFDAIISIDSFIYYGTDDLYLNSLRGSLSRRSNGDRWRRTHAGVSKVQFPSSSGVVDA
jgi:cyclopropane fatty-acyl-phospholipid synthase-like methyltransferase